ncbi:MAG: hypothetical protein H7237_00970 [Alkalinema sp. FL-bin-369]|nr:hypothetical protein [Leptolyngbyaceae cyanobacterium LF-bin-369]
MKTGIIEQYRAIAPETIRRSYTPHTKGQIGFGSGTRREISSSGVQSASFKNNTLQSKNDNDR